MARPRKKANRDVKSKIYIFCEGDKTEPEHIRAYIRYRHPNCTRLRKAEHPVNIEKSNKNTAVALVTEAVAYKKRLEHKEDQVWVVYDRESEAEYVDKLHKQAYDMAKSHDIKVAISNVCFEYWLLLHLREQAPGMTDCDTLISSPAFRGAFREIGIERYEKKAGKAEAVSQALMSDDYLVNATQNAERINKQTIAASQASEKKPYQLKPYTNVYELLQAIDRVATE